MYSQSLHGFLHVGSRCCCGSLDFRHRLRSLCFRPSLTKPGGSQPHLYCTVLYCAVLCDATFCYMIGYDTVYIYIYVVHVYIQLHYTSLNSTLLCDIRPMLNSMLHHTTLCYVLVCCTLFWFTMLYCTTLYGFSLCYIIL